MPTQLKAWFTKEIAAVRKSKVGRFADKWLMPTFIAVIVRQLISTVLRRVVTGVALAAVTTAVVANSTNAPPTTPTVDMYDTVTLSTVPSNPVALAGYTSGYWPTYLPLARAYPRARVVSIAINAFHAAQCLDVEPGDAVPAQAVSWFYFDRSHGFPKPCFYSSLGNGMGSIKRNLSNAGIPRSAYLLWDANWTYTRHLDAGYDATQWTDRAFGRNLDASVVTKDFIGATGPPPPPPDPYHYRALDKRTQTYHSKSGLLKMNELDVTLQYDFNRSRHSFAYPRLRRLQYLERVLANRVWTLGHGGHWGVAQRGVRYSVLRPRADGKKIAK